MINLELVRKSMDVDAWIISINLEDGSFVFSIASSKDLAIFDILGVATLDVNRTIFELNGSSFVCMYTSDNIFSASK